MRVFIYWFIYKNTCLIKYLEIQSFESFGAIDIVDHYPVMFSTAVQRSLFVFVVVVSNSLVPNIS